MTSHSQSQGLPSAECASLTGTLHAFAERLRERFGLWLRRARSRRELSELDERTLQDIGVTRSQARFESSKPFWID